MTRRIFAVLALTAALALAAAPGCAPSSNEKRQEIESLLKENPEIILDILNANQEKIFEIAEAGLRIKQERATRAAWQQQIDNPLAPAIDTTRAMRGDPAAPVTVVEYSDFQCPYCPGGSHTMDLLLNMRAGEIKLYFKHMPMSSHAQAMTSAKYFEAACLQDTDTCWNLHDSLFENQEAVEQQGETWIKRVAGEMGFDVERLEKDAAGEVVAQRIKSDLEEAEAFGFRGTPTFVVGGVVIAGAKPLEEFDNLLKMIQESRNATTPAAAGLPLSQGQAPICEDCGDVAGNETVKQ